MPCCWLVFGRFGGGSLTPSVRGREEEESVANGVIFHLKCPENDTRKNKNAKQQQHKKAARCHVHAVTMNSTSVLVKFLC
jgi:hypothetical protein